MLRGSMAKAVRDAGFDKLSTHGICSALLQDDLVYLLDLLTSHGLLGRSEHGCVTLTEAGGEVMRGQCDIPAGLARDLDASLVEPSAAQARKAKRRASRSGRTASSGDTYATTLGLLRSGKNFAEIADVRGLKERTVTDHVLKLAGRGDSFDLTPYLDDDILAQLGLLAENWQLGDALRPLKDEMPDTCSYEDIKIHLAQILMERA
jgi:uncharacterized protein YpbB